jgi:hypothetical protein
MDKVKIEILDDGSIKMTTDKVSAANHLSAEGIIREIAKLAGGEVTRKAREGYQQHSHDHGQTFHENH